MQRLRVAIAMTACAMFAPDASSDPRDLSVYIGAERARPGTWFGKLAFGGVDAPTLPPSQAGVVVELVRTGRRVDGIDITIPAESCEDLAGRLAKAWGPPRDETWYSRSGAQAAKLTGNDGFDLPCRLQFFRVVSPQQWLNTSRKSVVPIWVIGKPATELEAAISVLQPTRNDTEIAWEDTALDGSRVRLTATLSGTRIQTIRASSSMAPEQEWKRLIAMFGKPGAAVMDDEGTVRWTWRKAPGVQIATFAGSLPPPTPPAEPGFPIEITFGARPTR